MARSADPARMGAVSPFPPAHPPTADDLPAGDA